MQPTQCYYPAINEHLKTINSKNNDQKKVDDGIISVRSTSLIPTVNLETEVASTISDSITTPTATVTGDVALNLLVLPNSMTTEVAIKQYLTLGAVLEETVSWLLGDIERIKLLLENEDFDLSKQDIYNNTLLEKAFLDGKAEIFSLLWDHSKDKDRAKTFITCVAAGINYHIYFKTDCSFALNLFEMKKINAAMFTEIEQYNLLKKGWEEPSLIFVKKFLGLGFNINSKGEKGKSFLEEISIEIFDLAVMKKNYGCNFSDEEFFVRKIYLIQEYFQNLSWDSLTEKNSSNLKYDENQLDSVAPYLEIAPSLLKHAFLFDHIKIGQKVWDKANDTDRKKLFIDHFHSKLGISLIEDKKIIPDMLTEEEQYNIFRIFIQEIGDGRERDYDYEYNGSLNILIDHGFNIYAKDMPGRRGESLIDHLSRLIIKYYLKPDAHTDETMLFLNKVKFLKHCFEKTSSEFMKISTNDSFQLSFKNISEKSTFEKIAPYLVLNESMLRKAFNKGDIQIGTILWDKATLNDKKNTFGGECSFQHNSQLVLSLIENKKISVDMFTENEQHLILYFNLCPLVSNDNYNRLKCFEKLMEIGFNVKAKNAKGKDVKNSIIKYMKEWNQEDSKFYIQALKVIDKELDKIRMIELGVLLDSGYKDELSTLSTLPKDIINEIIKTLV